MAGKWSEKSIWLVVYLPILKNMSSSNGKDYLIYYGKYQMFETTNQSINAGFSWIFQPCLITKKPTNSNQRRNCSEASIFSA